MRKRPGPDQIAKILHEVQADLQAGLNINQARRKGGIGLTTYYRWKALQEGPISGEQLKILDLERENARLKELVAELALDRRMLQEALKKSERPRTWGGEAHRRNPLREAEISRFWSQSSW